MTNEAVEDTLEIEFMIQFEVIRQDGTLRYEPYIKQSVFNDAITEALNKLAPDVQDGYEFDGVTLDLAHELALVKLANKHYLSWAPRNGNNPSGIGLYKDGNKPEVYYIVDRQHNLLQLEPVPLGHPLFEKINDPAIETLPGRYKLQRIHKTHYKVIDSEDGTVLTETEWIINEKMDSGMRAKLIVDSLNKP